MAFGFVSYNDSGFLQIDDQNSAYHVLQSGTALASQTVSFTTQTEKPLVMVRPPYGQLIWGEVGLSSFKVFHGEFPSSGQDFSYDYAVLSRAIDGGPTITGYGLQLFNGSSQIVFDSAKGICNLDSHTSIITLAWSGAAGAGVTVLQSGTVNVPVRGFWRRFVSLNGLTTTGGVLQGGTEYFDFAIKAKIVNEGQIYWDESKWRDRVTAFNLPPPKNSHRPIFCGVLP